jgi:YcaO-like protein with predicted kinase domain
VREALALARSLAPSLGITRVARVTGLDRVGIPVWTAFRPNGQSISVTQGKGVDDDAAQASAVFEAVELAVAEAPHPLAFEATRAALTAAGRPTLKTRRFVQKGQSEAADDEPLRWVEGLNLISGEPIFVPEEIAGMAEVPNRRYWQRSDGLGAGSNLFEAAIHGICELIERDAMALWSFRGDSEIDEREIAPADLQSSVVTDAEARIADAGMRLRLFDITSDIRVPSFLALLMPTDRAAADMGYLDMAAGSATHPFAVGAALGAIAEAAQTRLTTIAGSRDDVHPEEYERALPLDLAAYARPGKSSGRGVAFAAEYAGPKNLPGRLEWLVECVRSRGIRTLALAPLAPPDLPFTVVRTIAPELEQDPRSGMRDLGRRALAAMLGQR